MTAAFSAGRKITIEIGIDELGSVCFQSLREGVWVSTMRLPVFLFLCSLCHFPTHWLDQSVGYLFNCFALSWIRRAYTTNTVPISLFTVWIVKPDDVLYAAFRSVDKEGGCVLK